MSTIASLALIRAAMAHGERDKWMGGEHDATWPTWYAAYMVGEQAGTELPQIIVEAVPLQLGEPLRSWVLDPNLDNYRKIDPRAIVNASLDKVAGGVADEVRADYLACYDGGHFVWEEAPAEYAAIILDSITGNQS